MAKRKEREPESEREEKVPMLKSNAAKRSTTAADKRKAEKKDAETQILAQRAKDEEDEPLSTYLPLPWKGRLGYACLNTYLRASKPPVFCSRTCRIDTMLKQGDWKTHGLPYVQSLGLSNARDLATLIHWNERYNIRFLRVSSDMFPFASHAVYGYDLGFAVESLREAGRVAMKGGHRLSTHPGQYTQLGSPREEVVRNSVRDLEYHEQMLSGLGLMGQTDKDAVMILHMGGVFGDKEATLERFRRNYGMLSEGVRRRLVLENDDVSWSVMDLLPICRELGIPLVLDYHHHNIVHSPGTRDITPLFPAIAETWTRKGITQKQHYSEPCAGAVTPRDMRKHSSRVSKLPSCDPSMDLMIEAKDKEQAVLELYQKYGICGGGEGFNEVVPHERRNDGGGEVEDEAEAGMGGSERRVYYPLGKEEWLAPKKKVVKKKDVVEEKVEDEPNDEEVGNEPKKARRKAVGGKKETAEKSGPKQKRARKATLDADAQPPPAPKTKNTKPDPQHSLEDPPPRLTRSRAKKLFPSSPELSSRLSEVPEDMLMDTEDVALYVEGGGGTHQLAKRGRERGEH